MVAAGNGLKRGGTSSSQRPRRRCGAAEPEHLLVEPRCSGCRVVSSGRRWGQSLGIGKFPQRTATLPRQRLAHHVVAGTSRIVSARAPRIAASAACGAFGGVVSMSLWPMTIATAPRPWLRRAVAYMRCGSFSLCYLYEPCAVSAMLLPGNHGPVLSAGCQCGSLGRTTSRRSCATVGRRSTAAW